MGRPKGLPKTGGRVKGTPNKMTTEVKLIALAFLGRRTEDEIETLWEATKAESPGKAMAMWLNAQEFVLPRLARAEVSGPDGDPLTINIVTYAPPKE